MPRGGARKGAGRKKLPTSKRRTMESVKMLPAAKRMLKKMSQDHGLSRGKFIEKLLGFDPEPGEED